jgi:hypothetical protein
MDSNEKPAPTSPGIQMPGALTFEATLAPHESKTVALQVPPDYDFMLHCVTCRSDGPVLLKIEVAEAPGVRHPVPQAPQLFTAALEAEYPGHLAAHAGCTRGGGSADAFSIVAPLSPASLVTVSCTFPPCWPLAMPSLTPKLELLDELLRREPQRARVEILDTVPVEREGDGLHTLARGVVPEDPLHNRRFLRVDLEPGGRRMLGSPAGCLPRGRSGSRRSGLRHSTHGVAHPARPRWVLSRRSSRYSSFTRPLSGFGVEQRPGYQQLVAAAGAAPPGFDTILVEDLSRLTRDTGELLRLYHRLRLMKHLDGDLVIVPRPSSTGERRAEISGRAKADSLLIPQEAVCLQVVAGAGFEPATFGL